MVSELEEAFNKVAGKVVAFKEKHDLLITMKKERDNFFTHLRDTFNETWFATRILDAAQSPETEARLKKANPDGTTGIYNLRGEMYVSAETVFEIALNREEIMGSKRSRKNTLRELEAVALAEDHSGYRNAGWMKPLSPA